MEEPPTPRVPVANERIGLHNLTAPEGLPDGFVAVPMSDGSGDYYYWDIVGNLVSWERPPARTNRSTGTASPVRTTRAGTPANSESPRVIIPPPPPPMVERILMWERRRQEFDEEEWEWREKRKSKFELSEEDDSFDDVGVLDFGDAEDDTVFGLDFLPVGGDP